MGSHHIPVSVPTLRDWPSFPEDLPLFDPSTAPEEPVALFVEWLVDAGAEGLAVHATVLSTVDRDGKPDARVVILKDVGANGWHVASSADSPKGRQLATNPHAALTFFWPHRGRQVRIRGTVVAQPRDTSAKDFLSRPLPSRIEGLIGRQSEVLTDPAELDRAAAIAKHRAEADPDFVPSGWTRFTLMAETVEFWQARHDRKHVRLYYRANDHGWSSDLLWP